MNNYTAFRGAALLAILACLLAGPVRAAAAPDAIVAATRALQHSALRLGLDSASDFLVVGSEVDSLSITHTRFRQRYRGVPVWGGDIVTHTGADGTPYPVTNGVVHVPRIDTAPRLTRTMALAVADRAMRRQGQLSAPPRSELLLFPVAAAAGAQRAAAFGSAPVYRLAWHLLLATRNAQDGLREMRYFIDAHDGAILASWSELQRAHVVATAARSIFSGVIAVNANSAAGAYELRDLQRGAGGRYGSNAVLRYQGAGAAAIFTDATNTWGDGASYIPGSASNGSDDTAQSAGVDVAYATAVAWDMYRNVFGRAGFDGTGTSVHATVHMYYGWPYNTGANASWSPSCECMDFGYGDPASGLKNVVDIDIVGHELAHGLIQKTAGLVYRGEPGGLNEGIADIFGLAAKFYAREGGHARAASTVTAGNAWSIGEGLGDPRFQRYFVRPSAEPGSFDAWDSSFIDQADIHDVHRISGPVRRAFRFMSQGAPPSGEGATPWLPAGMQGVGLQRALALWYRALRYYMTPLTDFAGARQALLTAARDLHGAGSAEERAVWDAFGGIHVGLPWMSRACGRLDSSQQLTASQAQASCNGQYALTMQADGNLVLSDRDRAVVWHAGTGGNPGAYLVMQSDGNLVLYRGGGLEALWHAGSWGVPDAAVLVGNDGNLSAVAPNGVPVWSLFPLPGATPQRSSQRNISLPAADAVGSEVTGLTGMASWNYATGIEQPAYFRFLVPPQGTIGWDFVGGTLRSSKWSLEAMTADGAALASASAATRQSLSWGNRSGSPVAVILRIGRQNFEAIPDALTQRFTIAIAYSNQAQSAGP